jgi:uncharacterized protein
VSSNSDTPTASSGAGGPAAPRPVKIVVAGGFGVGKTTLVGAISEIEPLSTEKAMTALSHGIDDRGSQTSKTTTTVAMDFGKAPLGRNLMLYVFGTPGQDRFGFMWDDLIRGALGAIVLVDAERLDQCYPAIDYFEHRETPFVVAVNEFEGQDVADLDKVRWALDVHPDVPVISVDARDLGSVKQAMVALLSRTLAKAREKAAAAA